MILCYFALTIISGVVNIILTGSECSYHVTRGRKKKLAISLSWKYHNMSPYNLNKSIFKTRNILHNLILLCLFTMWWITISFITHSVILCYILLLDLCSDVVNSGCTCGEWWRLQRRSRSTGVHPWWITISFITYSVILCYIAFRVVNDVVNNGCTCDLVVNAPKEEPANGGGASPVPHLASYEGRTGAFKKMMLRTSY